MATNTIRFVKYRTDTGEILCTGNCAKEEHAYLQMEDPENEHILLDVAADDATQWVNDEGDIVARPTLDVPETASIIADGISEVTGALPAGTVVRFNGAVATTDGSDFGFTTDMPGTYVFDFQPPFPYIPRTLTIESTDAV
ncbi:hypothetical protein SAMN05892877_1322 [Rhizobium subbaraonis]|uniref:Uncharacterized protein n=1 Tax=Rhizobium subbaraonis TaxID=908946 RepID=A0A285V3Q6_9HYPH|nr:hypothetical protein [Rhizobium subbaraonis]SOC47636.1 hypothetical protein SAMN05892877_1322 [Rhizobium subbaraonis]